MQLEAGENATFVFTNTTKPTLHLVKRDSYSGERLSGAVFRIASLEDSSQFLDRTTDASGEINLSSLSPGMYSVQETEAPEGYLRDDNEYHVELVPGKVSELEVSNNRKPSLTIFKRDADSGVPVPGTVFQVKAADGHSMDEVETDAEGRAELKNLLPGVYQITEKSVPAEYLLDAPAQLVTLQPNRNQSVYFENHVKPGLTIHKVDSVTGDALANVKFHITYASNHTSSGEVNDLGDYLTDAQGEIYLTGLQDGWYKVQEIDPPSGYAKSAVDTQEFYLTSGTRKSITFENTPLSALVVYKYDSVSGQAVEGAAFELRYLSGTSGTGGTVIGTYETSVNGSFTVSNLKAGTYVVEEVSAPAGYVIDTAPQTVHISGNGQDVVQLFFGDAPKGSVLIKKIDAITHEPLSDTEFLITDSSGAFIGNESGRFTTDSYGTILLENLNPGQTLVVKETKTGDGYILDQTAQTIRVVSGETVSLEFRNRPRGNLIVQKVDGVTGRTLPGAQFTDNFFDFRGTTRQKWHF